MIKKGNDVYYVGLLHTRDKSELYVLKLFIFDPTHYVVLLLKTLTMES